MARSKLQRKIERILRDLSFEGNYSRFKTNLIDILSKENYDKKSLRQLRKMIKPYMDEEVGKYWDTTLDAYERTLKVINRHYPDMGSNIQMDTPVIRAIERVNRDELGAYSQETVDDIGRIIRRGVRYNKGYKEIAKDISAVDDKAQAYAETIAKTQVKAVSRAATLEKADSAEIRWFEYVGIRTDTTRPFCLAHIGTYHHIDSIKKMRNGNREPVRIYAGGWNCRHDWEPDPFYSGQADGREKIDVTLSDGSKIVRPRPVVTPDFTGTSSDVIRDFQRTYMSKPGKLEQWMEKARWQRNPYRRKDLVQDFRKHAPDFDRKFSDMRYFVDFANRVMEDADQIMYRRYLNKGTGELDNELLFFNKKQNAFAVIDDTYKIRGCFFSEDIEKTIKAYQLLEDTIWL